MPDHMGELKGRYKAVFSIDIDLVKGVTVRLVMSVKAIPKFMKGRFLPNALQESVARQLNELQKAGHNITNGV